MKEQVLAQLIHLTGLTENDFVILKKSASKTQKWVDDFTLAFYDILFAYKPTAEVFRDGERPAREAGLKAWYLKVTSGDVTNKSFWDWQWYVGLIHIPRKVPNLFMLGMMSRIQQLFLHRCLQDCEKEEAEKVFMAFKHVTDVVAGLIAESYLHNYTEAMEHILGMKPELIARLMGLEINNMVDRAIAEKTW